MIRPLGNRVLIEMEGSPKQTPGGIALPDSAQKSHGRAVVKAVGPGKWFDGDDKRAFGYQLIPLDVGQKVLVGQYAGVMIDPDNENLRIVDADEILAVVE